uniref:Astacin domain-containing protein n=1 Tax=Steinernema glaseri TaxID=37863 RepID=A0A1I7XY25_9BILA
MYVFTSLALLFFATYSQACAPTDKDGNPIFATKVKPEDIPRGRLIAPTKKTWMEDSSAGRKDVEELATRIFREIEMKEFAEAHNTQVQNGGKPLITFGADKGSNGNMVLIINSFQEPAECNKMFNAIIKVIKGIDENALATEECK